MPRLNRAQTRELQVIFGKMVGIPESPNVHVRAARFKESLKALQAFIDQHGHQGGVTARVAEAMGEQIHHVADYIDEHLEHEPQPQEKLPLKARMIHGLAETIDGITEHLKEGP
ncbi:hypothetical protein [Rhodococcus sp. 11-3]|uniref:hypothetical protein n=1 Tax=Rhodococcus sp. 11-3 TaxID=2854796 RepID=UPI0020408C51|nr:hypothetical protein [Rhodococcus sp. 11-3]USC17061.1 hypothetical protein KZJ41_09415 [Rhodococcus sp. 11-3]